MMLTYALPAALALLVVLGARWWANRDEDWRLFTNQNWKAFREATKVSHERDI